MKSPWNYIDTNGNSVHVEEGEILEGYAAELADPADYEVVGKDAISEPVKEVVEKKSGDVG
jgi:hypothetical protein